jgi:hypothetical protein
MAVLTETDLDQRERLDSLFAPPTTTHVDVRTKVLAAVEALVEAEGAFTALVAAFGKVDSQGDRILHGAFQQSLADWRAAGKRIPIVWSHEVGDPARLRRPSKVL